MSLADRLQPCGPVADASLAARVAEAVQPLPAWAALAPIAGASPYLGGIMRRDPALLARLLAGSPDPLLENVLRRTAATGLLPLDVAQVELRRLKSELHLLTAICDLGGVWSLDQVTGALARFADAAVQAALQVAAGAERARGRLRAPPDEARGPAPGLFCLALGKHGAFELNYSSDIDVSVFYTPSDLPVAEGVEPEAVALRLTRTLADLLQQRTGDGYVFRVDLRLRPDPSSTPVAMPVVAALDYYESVGQNWERAAMIKARVCAGDTAAGEAFLAALKPFIWRRSLDFAAIADIHAIKRQIHAWKVDDRLSTPGANLKLGRGGIREIEFFVQTQQLILGGRDDALRAPRTLDALAALARAGHVTEDCAAELAAAYVDLRGWEHRVQMLDDEQTHVLPAADEARARVAALSGFAELAAFDARVEQVLRRVNARYGELFAEDEPLSSPFGNLVFTGVDDDPETLATLARMGFSRPAGVAATIRAWHHGRIAATRTERGRALLTRLAPQLLEVVRATGAPDTAFVRFTEFFSGLSSGVQIQSLFLAQPRLFELVVRVLAYSPELARTLARRPAAMDALLDADFFGPIETRELTRAMAIAVANAGDFEAALDATRRVHREQVFRVGVQVLSAMARPDEAGEAFAALADACINVLAPEAMRETARVGGQLSGGEVCVLALGKAGSREMTVGSDLDLMTVYDASAEARTEPRGWSADAWFARFTQRLVAALSAPTAEGGLYEVDMRLRPSGTSGPVAVKLAAFETYYAESAETWEFLALSRARLVWASSPGFADRCRMAIETALRRPRAPDGTRRDVAQMRALMRRERPARGFWDLKLADGGLVDVEFAAQTLQILGAAGGGRLTPSTVAALTAAAEEGRISGDDAAVLIDCWELHQAVAQILRLAVRKDCQPEDEPAEFQQLVARAVGVQTLAELRARLDRARSNTREVCSRIIGVG
jgi:[glutamine synthetase] adenylyltransferase / [glutamine synthetase]-adenylyl-L-tyrosine phosphorylase